MKSKKTIEGEFFKVSGPELEEGDSVSAVMAGDAIEFKDEIIIMGEGGFKAYPSEKLFVELSEKLEKYRRLNGFITEIKKEGIYNALFRID